MKMCEQILKKIAGRNRETTRRKKTDNKQLAHIRKQSQ